MPAGQTFPIRITWDQSLANPAAQSQSFFVLSGLQIRVEPDNNLAIQQTVGECNDDPEPLLFRPSFVDQGVQITATQPPFIPNQVQGPSILVIGATPQFIPLPIASPAPCVLLPSPDILLPLIAAGSTLSIDVPLPSNVRPLVFHVQNVRTLFIAEALTLTSTSPGYTVIAQ